MKTLLLLRHGKSSWSNDNLADHERPLKKRGIRDSTRIGKLIKDEEIIPDVVFCSTARRAKDTAHLVLDSCGFEGVVTYDRTLYHGYSGDFIDLLVGMVSNERIVMIVGHNPGLEEFLSDLSLEEEWLPTAALAQVSLNINEWSEFDGTVQGEIVNVWRPRDLR